MQTVLDTEVFKRDICAVQNQSNEFSTSSGIKVDQLIIRHSMAIGSLPNKNKCEFIFTQFTYAGNCC